MSTIAKISERKVTVGGEQHTGWLPKGAVAPTPTPIRELLFDFEISDDGGGNFLFLYQSADKSCYGDTWHQSVEEAIAAACEGFGIERQEWKFLPSE